MLPAIALSVVLQLSNAAGVPPSIAAKAQAEVVRLYREIASTSNGRERSRSEASASSRFTSF